MHGSLLVPYQHMLDGVLLVERVVNVQHGTAGIAPDVLDTFGLEGLDEDFCAAEFLGGCAGGSGSGGQFGLVDFHDEPFENFSDEIPWVLLHPLL
ncbi:hypothetical protein FQZ97_986920 [compost metagenome]